jgi:hypothetical protein
MRNQIWETVFACPQCASFNPPHAKVGAPLHPIDSTYPHHILGFDFLGPLPPDALGRRYALVGIDHFSKYAFIRPCYRNSAPTAIRFLRDLFKQVGKFEEILTDTGSAFKSKRFQKFMSDQSIYHHITSKRHFQANGACERLIRNLRETLVKFSFKPNHWSRFIPTFLNGYNFTPHTAHGALPSHLFFNHTGPSPADIKHDIHIPTTLDMEDIHRKQTTYRQDMVRSANRRRQPIHVNDMVIWFPRRPAEHKHSADRHYRQRRIGPLQVIEVRPHNRFLVAPDAGTSYVVPGFEIRRLNSLSTFH